MIWNSGFETADLEAARRLAENVFGRFQTRDVFEIAERCGVKIVYQKWFPVTLGEFDWRTKTIIVNEYATIETEKIIAHELGHYFLREFDVKNVAEEEKFCDEFADRLLKKNHAEAQKAQS
jgi:Zn-dependent peptidase ImmA (M78 family)